MGKIYEDTRQQNDGRGDKHANKHKWWNKHGVEVIRMKLDVGDYMNAEFAGNISVDTKRSMSEIAQNISGKNHERFKRECVRAQESGIKLYVLVESDAAYKSVGDVVKWTNKHCRYCPIRRKVNCNPKDPKGRCARHGTLKPIQGPRLSKAMKTMEQRYGVTFLFCHPMHSARIVCDLLGAGYDEPTQLELGGEL